ncbi:MAG: GNAT family N-acetyltransferase [Saprospiraceae bacterium]|nr:GNAT family N-acetyltransferase [Saprospiraceae bacterium]
MHPTIYVNDQIQLTGYRPEDKVNLIRFLNDPVTYRNTLRIPKPYTNIHADEWLSFVREELEKANTPSKWAIRHASGELIGGIGRFLRYGADSHADEIGYWLGEPYRGQGIMTEAITAFCHWLFTHSPLVRIEATVFEYNTASLRVLEKCNFERECLARKKVMKDGQLLDAYLMARIKG